MCCDTLDAKGGKMKLTVRRQRSGITIRLEIGDVILTVELPKQSTQTAI
jgi:hypothetical protein